MNVSEHRSVYPRLRDEEARVVENTIRLAVDSILNVLASVDCARTREHERVLAEREREISRLTSREEHLERELRRLLRRGLRRRHVCGTGGGGVCGRVDHSSVSSDQPADPEVSDPWPGCGDDGDDGQQAGRGQRETSVSRSLLQTPPTQASSPNQGPVAPSPAVRSAVQQTVVSHTPEAVEALEARQILLDIPVIKEETFHIDAACERSDLHTLVLLPSKPGLDTAPLQSDGDDDGSSVDSKDEDSPGDEYQPTSPESERAKMSANHTWHYNFKIPWNKMSMAITQRLKNGERPSASERREVIRVIAADLLATCRTTGKKHVVEIARKVMRAYPKSFRDEIAGEVVGSGYDSIVRQIMSNIYNVRRSESPRGRRKSTGVNKFRCRSTYGCINPEPSLPAGETQVTQRMKMEELKLMFKNQDKDTKKMEELMMLTFASQRKDILTVQKDWKKLLENWPYLFQLTGMRIHFRELTGIQISESFEDAMARKFGSVLDFFQSLSTDPSSQAGDLLIQTQVGSDRICGVVLLLLVHFNEQEDKMFVQVDDATVASEVDTTMLPWTPCIIVCGESPLKAKAYMVAVNQVVISERLSTFVEALHMMFYSYYIHNMDYPLEIWATMEFLQRCIFKINPDQVCKVERHGGAGHALMAPKVLSLLSRMSALERR